MLRAHIPSAAKQKKMSKVDTLKHAVDYIQNLQVLLNEKSHHNSTTSNTDFMLQQPPHTGKMNFLIVFFPKFLFGSSDYLRRQQKFDEISQLI